jgi:hypothetical protein
MDNRKLRTNDIIKRLIIFIFIYHCSIVISYFLSNILNLIYINFKLVAQIN